MLTVHRYQLESRSLTGKSQQKTHCPRCMRSKCFVRYVDTHDGCRYLSNEVGRCDHELSCGYHYTPREYFEDHPWLREGKEIEYERKKSMKTDNARRGPLPPPPLHTLSAEWPLQYHSPGSNFWCWFAGECAQRLGFSQELLQCIYEDYLLGATQGGHIVFWQIDEQQRVRTGHIMQYGADGHRRGSQNWIHSYLISQGLLPQNFVLLQCLFGQHLLPKYPDKNVCIVESEKTALVMAAHRPEHLWLATCGCNGLNAERLECLRGRRFTLFPDSGCYGKWSEVMKRTSGLQFVIDGSLEQYPPNTDLADILLHQA